MNEYHHVSLDLTQRLAKELKGFQCDDQNETKQCVLAKCSNPDWNPVLLTCSFNYTHYIHEQLAFWNDSESALLKSIYEEVREQEHAPFKPYWRVCATEDCKDILRFRISSDGKLLLSDLTSQTESGPWWVRCVLGSFDDTCLLPGKSAVTQILNSGIIFDFIGE